MTIILLGMCLTLVENTLVALIAVNIYFKQQKTTKEMEKKIENAIKEVKTEMTSDKIISALGKGVVKRISGWKGGKTYGANHTIKQIGGMVGILNQLSKAKTLEEKALIFAEWGAQKLAEAEDKKKAEQGPPPLTPEEFATIKNSEVTIEQYTEAFNAEQKN